MKDNWNEQDNWLNSIAFIINNLITTYMQQWKLHIFELEEEMKIDPSIKYVIYQVRFLTFVNEHSCIGDLYNIFSLYC